jgi:hypothetical protein
MHMYMRCPTQTQKGKRAQNSQAPPKHMHWGQRAYKAHPKYMIQGKEHKAYKLP